MFVSSPFVRNMLCSVMQPCFLCVHSKICGLGTESSTFVWEQGIMTRLINSILLICSILISDPLCFCFPSGFLTTFLRNLWLLLMLASNTDFPDLWVEPTF